MSIDSSQYVHNVETIPSSYHQVGVFALQDTDNTRYCLKT